MYFLNTFWNYIAAAPSIFITLVIFMLIEFITFLLLCMLFTNNLNHKDLYKNLAKKFVMILLVLMVYRIDLLLQTPYLYTIYIAFIANEIILIVENITLMGMPVPRVIINIVSIFKNRYDEIQQKEPLGVDIKENEKSQN